ncbi:flagellar biosynthetic protein FliO [Psychromonas sp. Urea-02u-13]|uniref:flagellar biosynthetic protein FliO n=1 Tax=Psychromonas sp. Urea-02u-13 TaxID=2058326 RepID=UPI000C33EFC1|nr:flagellar biosynthetic protein FliO [Psychromonas sp. Urea-02u-13]PKG39856.1 flagellar biosynthetic protein FliO [Psychromonas sp. Urea-02u-13]
MNYAVVVVALFFPATSWAEEALKSSPDLAVGSMIASLLLVIACIFIFAFLMKKSNLIHNGRGKTLIKVIATQPLTNKGRVQIIEVGEKRYIVGVTEQQISLLDTIAIPEDELLAELSPETPINPFASLLSKISAKRNE